jgi:hypothetical protein
MLIPLYGFVRGDTLGLLVLVQASDTVAELAANLKQAASPRIPPGARATVRRNGAVLDDTMTVAEVGFTPLERVDLTLEPAP